MLYFVANYNQSQIVNRSGQPFAGSVVSTLRELELYETLGDLVNFDLVSVAELTKTGPGGFPGVILSVGAAGHRPTAARFEPERQAWMRVSSAVWIGTEVDPVSGSEVVPTPEQLDRGKCPVETYENVVFANGSIWEVPVLRELSNGPELLIPDLHRPNLPQMFFRDADKVWRSEVVPRYQDLWLRSQKMFEALCEGDRLTYVDLITFAADVLSLRYRFGLLVHTRWPAEWITTENVVEIIRAAIGWKTVERYAADQKKNLVEQT